jgi:large subunit ribosomal protein L17
MLRNLTTSMVIHERICTTLHKAKELRGMVDQMITLGKRGDVHSRRLAASVLFDDDAVKKVFDDLAKRFQDRPGGYTRILRLGDRFGDGAKQAAIEFVDYKFEAEGKDSEKAEKKSKKG